MGFYVTWEGRDVALIGDVYPIRDSLRALKFKWDPAKRYWWTTAANWQNVYGDVIRLPGYEPPPNKNLKPGATPNQIAFASRLLRQMSDDTWVTMGKGHRKPTDEDLKGMTKTEISNLLDTIRRKH